MADISAFISYNKSDLSLLKAVTESLTAADYAPWQDGLLTVGQDWWETILGQIRGSDVFFAVATDRYFSSEACLAELHYAQDSEVPVVFLLGEAMSHEPPLAGASVPLDSTIEEIASAAATSMEHASPRASRPRIADPPAPLPASSELQRLILLPQGQLAPRDEWGIVDQLESHLRDPENADWAQRSLRLLRDRSDLTAHSAGRIARLLALPAPDERTGRRSVGRALLVAAVVSGAALGVVALLVRGDDSPEGSTEFATEAEGEMTASSTPEEDSAYLLRNISLPLTSLIPPHRDGLDIHDYSLLGSPAGLEGIRCDDADREPFEPIQGLTGEVPGDTSHQFSFWAGIADNAGLNAYLNSFQDGCSGRIEDFETFGSELSVANSGSSQGYYFFVEAVPERRDGPIIAVGAIAVRDRLLVEAQLVEQHGMSLEDAEEVIEQYLEATREALEADA